MELQMVLRGTLKDSSEEDFSPKVEVKHRTSCFSLGLEESMTWRVDLYCLMANGLIDCTAGHSAALFPF